MSTPIDFIHPNSEPKTSKAAKRKRQTSQDDPSPSKKPKPEKSTPKQQVPASGPAPPLHLSEKHVNLPGEEDSHDPLKDEEEVGA